MKSFCLAFLRSYEAGVPNLGVGTLSKITKLFIWLTGGYWEWNKVSEAKVHILDRWVVYNVHLIACDIVCLRINYICEEAYLLMILKLDPK